MSQLFVFVILAVRPFVSCVKLYSTVAWTFPAESLTAAWFSLEPTSTDANLLLNACLPGSAALEPLSLSICGSTLW